MDLPMGPRLLVADQSLCNSFRLLEQHAHALSLDPNDQLVSGLLLECLPQAKPLRRRAN